LKFQNRKIFLGDIKSIHPHLSKAVESTIPEYQIKKPDLLTSDAIRRALLYFQLLINQRKDSTFELIGGYRLFELSKMHLENRELIEVRVVSGASKKEIDELILGNSYLIPLIHSFDVRNAASTLDRLRRTRIGSTDSQTFHATVSGQRSFSDMLGLDKKSLYSSRHQAGKNKKPKKVKKLDEENESKSTPLDRIRGKLKSGS